MAKNLQKGFALLLALSMLMSLLSVTAFAKEGGNNTLKVGGTLALEESTAASVKKEAAEAAAAAAPVWSSDEEAIATVADGQVTGLSAGTAAITCVRFRVYVPGLHDYESDNSYYDSYEDVTNHEDTAEVEKITLTWNVTVEGESAEVSEPPEETCTVEYRKQSATVTTKESYFDEPAGCFVVKLSIGAQAQGDQVVDLGDAIQTAMDAYAKQYDYTSYPVMPGDSNAILVTITNESGHDYRYQTGSFVLATADAHAIGNQTYALGYDGQRIPKRFINFIPVTPRYIYRDLFGVSKSTEVTADMVFDIYAYLAEQGYTGGRALTRYILDANHVTSTAKLSGDSFARAGSNGIFRMTREELDAQLEQHPEMRPYVFTQERNGALAVQFQWPETELAALSYDLFYEDYWSFAFGADAMAQLDPNKNTAYTRAHGIGDYRDGTDLYAQTDAYFAGLLGGGLLTNDADSALVLQEKLAWDGPGIGNGYMNYPMSFYQSIVLQQQDTTYTVTANYYTSTNGGAYAKDNADAVVLSGPTGTSVGQTVTADPTDAWAIYGGNTYALNEETSTLTLVAALDPAANVLTLHYYRDVRSGGDRDDDDDDPTPVPPTVIPDDPAPTTEDPVTNPPETPTTELPATEVPLAEVPKTGDAAALWLILAAVSAVGLAAVTLTSRKKKES